MCFHWFLQSPRHSCRHLGSSHAPFSHIHVSKRPIGDHPTLEGRGVLPAPNSVAATGRSAGAALQQIAALSIIICMTNIIISSMVVVVVVPVLILVLVLVAVGVVR